MARERRMTMAHSFLPEYKRHIKQIRERKGTAAWLKRFFNLVVEYESIRSKRKGGKTLLEYFNLTPTDLFHIRQIIQQLEKNKSCRFIEESLFCFFKEHSFDVQPEGIGFVVYEKMNNTVTCMECKYGIRCSNSSEFGIEGEDNRIYLIHKLQRDTGNNFICGHGVKKVV
jgi:hypothetical protein